MTAPDQAAWFDRLELEHDNRRTALSWAVDVGDVDLALRLGKSLWRFRVARGQLREWRLTRLLAMPGADARTLLRAGPPRCGHGGSRERRVPRRVSPGRGESGNCAQAWGSGARRPSPTDIFSDPRFCRALLMPRASPTSSLSVSASSQIVSAFRGLADRSLQVPDIVQNNE